MIDVSTAAPASRVEPHLTPHPHREPQVRRFQVLKVAPTPFFSDYGCHVRILEEARALQAHGSDVVVYTYPVGRDPERLRVVRSLGLPGFVHARPGSSAHKLYLDGFLTLRAAREVAFARPNIVHGHLHEGALIGLPISRALRVPLIFDFQGSLTAEMIDHGFLPRTSRLCAPLRWLEGTINRAVDAVITSSRPAADFLVREFGCPASKIAAIPDGVDPEVFRPYWEYSEAERRAVREQLGVPPNRRVVVYLGLLAEYQGSSYLLRAAARVARERPDVHFLLMGYPGEERYRAMARGLGIADRVTCTGRVPYEAAPRFLAAGDVAVAPKLATTEANGKLLNYMALGLPTVAFDSPVNRDILGAAGIFARLADDEDLARKLLDVLDSEVEAASRGRSLRRRAEGEFSWSEAGRRILEVYASVDR
jgi:glycosyltransferase involved in cell wall biosynthesis